MAAPPPYNEKEQYPPGEYRPPQPPPQGQYPPPQQGGYPPPQQGGYLPVQQSATTNTTIITTQPAMVSAVPIVFHEFPVSMTCPSCRAQIVTAVHYDVGTMAWLLCLVMCFFGFWLCMFIPFCVDGCKDAIHHCPNCSVQLGVYRRM